MQEPEKYLAVARQLSEEAEPEWRELFEVGTTQRPGGVPLLEQALDSWKGQRSVWLDPGPRLRQVACPVYLVHGREDVVIPWTEAAELEAMLPDRVHAGTWVTGFYDHTGHTGLLRQLLRLPLLVPRRRLHRQRVALCLLLLLGEGARWLGRLTRDRDRRADGPPRKVDELVSWDLSQLRHLRRDERRGHRRHGRGAAASEGQPGAAMRTTEKRDGPAHTTNFVPLRFIDN